jgi:alkanesulfonate monooxygenase SsuD/methylene tetrahydromethanopterin reductase-like flavin-dependent oxidoreductase (luciferase family)
VRYGDGWLPMISDPAKLAPAIAQLHELAAEAGRDRPEVACFGAVEAGDPARSADRLAQLSQIGVTRFIAGGRYESAAELGGMIDALAQVRAATRAP